MVDSFADHGMWGLIIVAFMEASFFPVPPDLILIPLTLINPVEGLWYALLCTLFSTLGALFGRWIGLKVGRPVLERFGSSKQIETVKRWFHSYGGWAVAFAGLTPIPFKVFTIASGVFGVRLRPVILGSLVGRGLRFFFEVFAIITMGDNAVEYLRQYSGWITFIGGVLLIIWLFFRRKAHRSQ